VILTNYLELVRKLMSAYFVDIEQVDDVFLLAHMKIPDAIELPSETMDGLICHNDIWCTLLMIKV
jgi:hypothetical protein